MQVFKEGDFVTVIDEPIYGIILVAGKKKSRLKDEDGFEREYPNSRLVIAKSEENYRLGSVQTKEPLISVAKKPVKKVVEANTGICEIDLHMEALSEKFTVHDYNQALQKQLSVCKSFVQKALRNHTRKIVIIHGKGEGVLKAAVHQYLNKLRLDHGIKLSYHDAPYPEYGMGGATEVIFG